MDNMLQQMMDRQAITDGLHWYTKWVDLNRVDKQVQIFTEDGRLKFGVGDDWTVGRANIEALITPLVQLYSATHHYITNIEITFEGADEARSQCYLHAWHRPADGSENFVLYAQYHDRWTRTADGWRITERRLKTAGTEGSPSGEAGLEPIGRAS
ncbi:nuclear transport factor 2 family protein [Emcibacter sp. SYSU 3D8]|uniref:nuclear transport factor 2 family protein n=1 Tax=Emcibacter sp. SYSU 3D8 TaxID=3133969 RepID=UPI0031FEDE91